VPTSWLSSERSLSLAVRGAESLGRRSRSCAEIDLACSEKFNSSNVRVSRLSAFRHAQIIAVATLQDPDCQGIARADESAVNHRSHVASHSIQDFAEAERQSDRGLPHRSWSLA
jgi:hypothetical protein